jgi:hypothetical protein
MPKTAPLGFRVEPDLKAALAKAAAADDRTVAAYVVHVLRDRLVRQGYLPAAGRTPTRKGRHAD